MMALTEHSIAAGMLTLFFYGVFPLSIVLWLMNTRGRRGRQSKADTTSGAERGVHDPDQGDAKRDQ